MIKKVLYIVSSVKILLEINKYKRNIKKERQRRNKKEKKTKQI